MLESPVLSQSAVLTAVDDDSHPQAETDTRPGPSASEIAIGSSGRIQRYGSLGQSRVGHAPKHHHHALIYVCVCVCVCLCEVVTC